MFGLFQADLPIGNRLWLTLLAIVVGGSIAATPLVEVASDPVSFGVNLLLLFGQATFITTAFLALPLLIVSIIEFEIKRRADKDRIDFFRETEEYNPLTTRALNYLSLVGYVASVFWIANNNFSASLGSFGLALFLFAEVIVEWREIYLSGYEYLELQKVKDTVKARLIREEKVEDFKVKEDWVTLHAYLGDNNWELIEFSKTFSLNRRDYRKGIIPQRWLEIFPKPLKSMFSQRAVRRRRQ